MLTRILSNGIVAVVAFAMVTCPWSARAAAQEPAYTVAEQDLALKSYFELDFGALGGKAVGGITRTDVVMRYQFDDAAPDARFLAYDQDVNELILPGGISTGAIRVEILTSQFSDLEFDPATGVGEFTTDDLYAVHFEGDLSMFGIESPFILPSVSTGTIEFETAATGNIDMEWEGSGQLGEGGPVFTYRCVIHTIFALPGNEADFNADGVVDGDDIAFFESCYSGPTTRYRDAVCEMTDFDGDSDVDRRDQQPILMNLSR